MKAPDFVSRDQWGADAPTRPIDTWKLSHVAGITVHHSAAPRDQSILNIQRYQMREHGWWDIGYSHLIRDGKIYTGRGWYKRPVHDKINTGLGVCVLGDYSTRLPSDADLYALAWYIEHARKKVGRKLPVIGHGDVPTNTTACPGKMLAQWVRQKRYERKAEPVTDFMSKVYPVRAHKQRFLDPKSRYYDERLENGVTGETAFVSGYLHSRVAAEELTTHLPVLARELAGISRDLADIRAALGIAQPTTDRGDRGDQGATTTADGDQ